MRRGISRGREVEPRKQRSRPPSAVSAPSHGRLACPAPQGRHCLREGTAVETHAKGSVYFMSLTSSLRYRMAVTCIGGSRTAVKGGEMIVKGR